MRVMNRIRRVQVPIFFTPRYLLTLPFFNPIYNGILALKSI